MQSTEITNALCCHAVPGIIILTTGISNHKKKQNHLLEIETIISNHNVLQTLINLLATNVHKLMLLINTFHHSC